MIREKREKIQRNEGRNNRVWDNEVGWLAFGSHISRVTWFLIGLTSHIFVILLSCVCCCFSSASSHHPIITKEKTNSLIIGMKVTLFSTFAVSMASALASGNSVHSKMKRVLVTGGNKGIGKAICQRLLQEYNDVHVLLGSRNAERGQQAVSDIQKELGQDVCKDRLELVCIDTASDESVARAADTIDAPLYGIVSNAGTLQGTLQDVVNVNYFGPKRVFEAFEKHLQKPGGRVVNMASAGGPKFNEILDEKEELYLTLTQPWTISGDRFAELDRIAKEYQTDDKYRFSKALVNAYTVLLAREQPDLIVNSITPGWIQTDMTAGSAASGTPTQGAMPPVWLLMSADLEKVPTGRYYGSDCVRSPLHCYRGPGEEPYEGPDGLEIQKESVLQQ